jgi:hypothetical protein
MTPTDVALKWRPGIQGFWCAIHLSPLISLGKKTLISNIHYVISE